MDFAVGVLGIGSYGSVSNRERKRGRLGIGRGKREGELRLTRKPTPVPRAMGRRIAMAGLLKTAWGRVNWGM